MVAAAIAAWTVFTVCMFSTYFLIDDIYERL